MTQNVLMEKKLVGTFHKKMNYHLELYLRPFQLLDDPIFVTDSEGLVIFWNHSAEKFYQIPSSEIFSRPLDEKIEISESDFGIKQILDQVTQKGYLVKEVIHRVEGKIGRSVTWSIKPIEIPESDFVGFLFIIKPGKLSDRQSKQIADQKLDDNQSRFRELAELIPEIAYETDLEGRVTFLNQNGSIATGFSQEEINKGITTYDLIVPEDHKLLDNNVKEILIGNNPKANQYTMVRKDGTRFPVLAHSMPIFNNNQPAGVRGFLCNLTDQMEAEKALRKSEERYRLLTENANDVVWTMTFDGRFTYVSPYVETLTGFTPEEVMNIPLLEYVTPESAMEMIQLISEQMQLPQEQRIAGMKQDFKQYTKDGSVLDIEVNATWLLNNQGEPIGIQGITRDISDRKAAEQALQESELKFRQMSDASLTGIFIHQNGELVYLNPRIAEILGYSDEDMQNEIGNLFFPFIHSEDREFVVQRAQKRLAGKHPVDHYEVRMVKKNGETVWTEILISLILHKNKPALMGHVIDISERKKMEVDLRKSDERFRELYHSMHDGIIAVDMDGTIIEFNAAFQEMIGYEKEYLHGLTYEEITPKIWHESEKKILETQVIKQGFSKPYPKEYRRKDGTVFPAEITTYLTRDERGKPTGMWSFIRDTTERLRAERALRESEEKYRNLYDTASVGLYQARFSDGKFLSANKTCANLMGYDSIHEFLDQYIAGENCTDTNRRDEMLDQLKQFGQVDGFEIEMYKKDGTPFTIAMSATLYPEMGLLEGVMVDITDKKEAEREKANLEDQLRQAQKMEAIGRLAGGVAHDFNNILTGITGYTEMILSSLGEGDPIRSDVEEVKRAGRRASALTNQLLAFSRKQIIAPKVLQMNEILAQSQKMLARIIGEDIDLYFAPEMNLWNIKADPSQIDQILINLAVNARDAMPDGGRLMIQTRNTNSIPGQEPSGEADMPGEFVRLSVTDNGHGMDAKTLRQIFEPFFSTKEKDQGTGLGLSTVYGIVNQNKGLIDVQSKTDVGTTFHIYLPRVKEEVEILHKPVPVAMPKGKETVLLVEDEEMVRGLATKVLRLNGYHVLEANSSREAFIQSDEHPDKIDLLLTDVVMPKMNGRELFEQLKAGRPEIKVLFMSGYTEDVISRHGVLDGDTQFIQKPFTIDSLALKVREVLDE